MSEIAIIDYGINNLKSVRKAVETCGHDSMIVSEGPATPSASAILLPGIGTFADGMAELRSRNLAQSITEAVDDGTPMLGICLGMQLLFSSSTEGGYTEGLDLLSGDVVSFEPPGEVDAERYTVPHMGWNEIHPPNGQESDFWTDTVLDAVDPGTDVYFVHSLFPDPTDSTDVLAVAEHGNQTFPAAVSRDNVHGTQFHPEKSGPAGVDIIRNFIDICNI